MIGFFSFTEVTDPGAHGAYNAWHQFDHLPEQFSVDGIVFGQRWVCTPACRATALEPSPLLRACHYMTLYLMRDVEVLPDFFELAVRLRHQDRFFAARTSHLSGPFTVGRRWVTPRSALSPAALPYRPAHGIYVVVGSGVDGERMVTEPGVAGAWSFSALTEDPQDRRHITVAFIDEDLLSTATNLGKWLSNPVSGSLGDGVLEWAAPLEVIDANRYDWFDRLTPQ